MPSDKPAVLPNLPLRFQEILVEKPWGGRSLADLGKKLPSKRTFGESWEIACRDGAVSVVAEGAFKGKDLRWLIERFPKELLGRDIAGGWQGRFPLLVKFIDAVQPLSVQVHPSDEFAAIAEGDGATGKIEAWIVIHTGPKARLMKGLVPGMTKEKFAAALQSGEVEKCLNMFPLAAGDIVLMPPGTVHAVEDALFAEFQQNSDTTYRLFDWGRPKREMHLEKGLAAIDYHTTGLAKCKAAEVRENLRTFGLIKVKRGSGKGKREVLVWCSRFVVESLELSGKGEFLGDPSRFYIVMAAEGQGEFKAKGGTVKWKKGQTFLMPAAVGAYTISTRKGKLLWCYVP